MVSVYKISFYSECCKRGENNFIRNYTAARLLCGGRILTHTNAHTHTHTDDGGNRAGSLGVGRIF